MSRHQEMSRFFPRVSDLPQQELRDIDMFVVNLAWDNKYQKSAIVHCRKQLNKFMHDQTSKKKADEKQKEERGREWHYFFTLSSNTEASINEK